MAEDWAEKTARAEFATTCEPWTCDRIATALRQARAGGMEEAARWHDQRRRDTPDAFEMELHQVSAELIRALKEYGK